MSEEVRVVSETGGEKGQKPAQASALDAKALLVLAEVAGFGARKYEAHNYLRGYRWSLSLDALHRHLWAFQSGEDLDPESGLPHMAHAAWHALALVSFQTRGFGTDDRFKQGPKPWPVVVDPRLEGMGGIVGDFSSLNNEPVGSVLSDEDLEIKDRITRLEDES